MNQMILLKILVGEKYAALEWCDHCHCYFLPFYSYFWH